MSLKLHNSKLFMLIDDNEIDLYITSMIIEKAEFTGKILLQQSAITAIDYLNEYASSNEHIPDIIFLDINMPEMDGFGFLQHFETMDEVIKNKTKIVMLTSSSDSGDMERANEYSYVKNYLVKPLKSEDIHLLNKLL